MSEKPAKVIDAAISQLGSPYVFGAWGEFCTPSNRGRRARADHPTIKSKCQVLNGSRSSCSGCQYDGDRMFDCRGFTYWCLKQVDITLTGQGATSQYNTDSNWIEKGEIADMPECVCCVFIADGNKKSHTGLYIGNNETVECSVGVQRKILDKRWTHYAIPAGLYTLDEIAEIRGSIPKPKHVVRKGDKGGEVTEIQSILSSLGYDCGAIDGVFGSRTLAAVKAFQQDHGLTPDGVVGTNTWAVLLQQKGAGGTFYQMTIPHLFYQQVQDLMVKYPEATFMAEG